MKVGKVKKAHKNEPALNFLCLLKKGPLTMRSLCGGALAAGGAMAALAGRVPILLCEHPLIARVSLSLSICKGSGSSGGGGGGTMTGGMAVITEKGYGRHEQWHGVDAD